MIVRKLFNSGCIRGYVLGLKVKLIFICNLSHVKLSVFMKSAFKYGENPHPSKNTTCSIEIEITFSVIALVKIIE